MNELSTEIKTHWIITHSGSHHQITAEQEAKLANIGLDDLIKIDDNSIKGSSIAEVLSNKTYFQTYPEKAPRNFGQPYSEPKDYTPVKSDSNEKYLKWKAEWSKHGSI